MAEALETNQAPDFKYIGTRPVRPDGVEKVTGRANFGADFKLPGMIHGKVVRSPHAHARIRSIDTARAESDPGGYGGRHRRRFSGPREARLRAAGVQSKTCWASRKVLYHGHAVAAVAGGSRTASRIWPPPPSRWITRFSNRSPTQSRPWHRTRRCCTRT